MAFFSSLGNFVGVVRKKYQWHITTLSALLVVFILFNVVFQVDVALRPRWRGLRGGAVAFSDPSRSVNWEEKLFPSGGVVLPVRFGDIGRKLVVNGVIDAAAFERLYAQRGGFDTYAKNLLYGAEIDENSKNGGDEMRMTSANASFLLNMFWALGLSNKNAVLDRGPMRDKRYGGAGNFASTGGWTLAKGDAMSHYSAHDFLSLTPEQQTLVENVSKNVYRPCCNNSTYFPDCNHGMAMLGFLELMASQGVTEEAMYRAALTVNAYWFPGTYLTVAQYLPTVGSSWEKASPRDLLGIEYSSASGFRRVLAQSAPVEAKNGPSCGV